MVEGIVSSIIAAILIAIAVALYKRVFGQQIVITHPRNDEVLTDPEPLRPGVSFPVRGTLKRLPKGHEILILTEDENTRFVWPQGFFNVKYDPGRKTWLGKVNGRAKSICASWPSWRRPPRRGSFAIFSS